VPKPPRPAPLNRRGSPEAIAKRRAARQLNELLGAAAPARDGRTEARRRRLLAELEAGKTRSGRALKPIDTLTRVHELLELHEPLASIRKVCRPPRATPHDPAMPEILRRLHEAYAFRPEAYRFVGLDEALLRDAGIVPAVERPRPSRRPG
jgi:hypothetical protein